MAKVSKKTKHPRTHSASEETIVLSNEDRDFVLKLLDEPLEPNENLKSLLK